MIPFGDFERHSLAVFGITRCLIRRIVDRLEVSLVISQANKPVIRLQIVREISCNISLLWHYESRSTHVPLLMIPCQEYFWLQY